MPRDRPAMIVAEGLMPYLASEEAPKLVTRLVAHFPSGELAFDGYGRLGLKMLRHHAAAARHRAPRSIGRIDDAQALEQEVPGLQLVEEKIQYDPAEHCADELAGAADGQAVAVHSGAAEGSAACFGTAG